MSTRTLTAATPVTPNACRWCDQDARSHAIEWADVIGYHSWIAPTTAQRKRRMLARRTFATRRA